MKIAAPGLAIIQDWEKGPKGTVALEAYQCDAGVWTIGWGHTKGVKAGDTCTREQADQWLREDCEDAENCVNTHVKAPLNQNQFDALVSLVFNIGGLRFINSTLLLQLNSRDYLGTSYQFTRWNRVRGQIARGLVTRRKDELDLFDTPV